MAKVTLEVKNLTKRYGDRLAVDNISFAVHEGEIFGFLGVNGSGKSTTIKMITGLTEITQGDAFINGNSVTYDFEKAIKDVGCLVETPCFYPYMTAYSNLKFLAQLSKITNVDEAIAKVADFVGLTDRLHDKVKTYSLGMKQRLGVAQALLHSPKILILDEPTNGLDANAVVEFRTFLKKLAKKAGVSILISSHILGEMESMCDTIGIIDNGRLIEVKPLSEIKNSLNSICGSMYIKCNAPNFAAKLLSKKFNGAFKILGDKIIFNGKSDIVSAMIVELTKNNIVVYGAGEVEHSLEEVFLTVVNRNKNSTGIV